MVTEAGGERGTELHPPPPGGQPRLLLEAIYGAASYSRCMFFPRFQFHDRSRAKRQQRHKFESTKDADSDDEPVGW